jgi:ABC-type multidrug transport system fused ATPase/permease subunit
MHPSRPWVRDRLPGLQKASKAYEGKIYIRDVYEIFGNEVSDYLREHVGRDQRLTQPNIRLAEKNFLMEINRYNVDTIVFATADNYREFLTLDFIMVLKSKGYKLVGFLGDDEFNHPQYRYLAAIFDNFVVYVEKYKKFYEDITENQGFLLLNSCHLPKIGKILNEPKTKYDTVMIGGPIPARVNVLRKLKKEGFSIAVYGPKSWQHFSDFAEDYKGFVNSEEFDIRLSEGKIILSMLEDHISGKMHMNTKIWECARAGTFTIASHYEPLFSNYGFKEGTDNEKLLAKLSFLFGRYRDLYVKNGFEKFVRDYLASDLNIRMSRAKVQIVGGLPKIVIETFFIILMGIFALYSLNNTVLSTSNIPFFVTLLFGMQKLLPQIQQIYQSKVALQSGSHALNEIKIFLNLPDRKAEFGFGKLLDSTAAFELRNIGFKHSKGDEPQIADLNFKIYRGEKICISGKSGSGKSTLVDLLIGLYTPTSGELCAEPINLTNNQFTILSQQFHIDNDSIRNLLLDNSKKHYSDENLFEILDIVNLGETIRALPGGLDYELLNDAQNLSGGQRQRLGLAISLMDDFDVLILDEVTSQLDRTLEHQIYENLFNYYSSKTIIFITHTEHLKKLADRIIQLD